MVAAPRRHGSGPVFCSPRKHRRTRSTAVDSSQRPRPRPSGTPTSTTSAGRTHLIAPSGTRPPRPGKPLAAPNRGVDPAKAIRSPGDPLARQSRATAQRCRSKARRVRSMPFRSGRGRAWRSRQRPDPRPISSPSSSRKSRQRPTGGRSGHRPGPPTSRLASVNTRAVRGTEAVAVVAIYLAVGFLIGFALFGGVAVSSVRRHGILRLAATRGKAPMVGMPTRSRSRMGRPLHMTSAWRRLTPARQRASNCTARRCA